MERRVDLTGVPPRDMQSATTVVGGFECGREHFYVGHTNLGSSGWPAMCKSRIDPEATLDSLGGCPHSHA